MSDIVRWFISSASFWNVNAIPCIERYRALASSSDAAAAFVVAVPVSFHSCWLFNTLSSNNNTANGERNRQTGRGENCEILRSTAEREQEVKHWLEKVDILRGGVETKIYSVHLHFMCGIKSLLCGSFWPISDHLKGKPPSWFLLKFFWMFISGISQHF